MLKIPEITAADSVFGTVKHMPRGVPKEFRDWDNEWHEVFTRAFMHGGTLASLGIKPKDGVDAKRALAAIRAVMSSFEPKHEEKAAACAFMFSEWFDRVEPEPK